MIVPRRTSEWAAGVFEGEGAITWCGGPRLVITNHDPWVLDEVRSVMGGKVYGPYVPSSRDGHRRKPIYKWQVTGWDRSIEAFEKLRPWLSPRRVERAEEVLYQRVYTVRRRR
jgi:hypothetical protein